MFWKKASEWANLAPNCPSAVRFGLVASKGFEKLVIVPKDPSSVEFLAIVDGLATEAIAPDLAPAQLDEIAADLETKVANFGRSQRRVIENSIEEVYEGLREILTSLEGAISTSENLGSATEDASARLMDLQSAKNYEEVIVGLKKEISTLNKAVSQYKVDAKLIRSVASQHVEQLRTKLKVAEQAVCTDYLTKLGNRGAFDLQLSFAISRLAQSETYCLAMIDVDKFKNINDTYGHLGGDAALVEIAKRLSETFAQVGTSVVRYGGDEFAVLYRGSNLQLEAKLERVNSVLAKSPLMFSGKKISLHTSYGTVELNQNHTPKSAFSDADHAMYEDKKSKRNAA